MQTLKLAGWVAWRFAVMALCAAAVASTGWYVAYEGLFEAAFATRNGMLVGAMCVSGFLVWLTLSAHVFVTLQTELLNYHRVRQVWRAQRAARARIELIMATDATPFNARKTMQAISRIKG